MFNQDFNELLSIFTDHKIKYLVVGGCGWLSCAAPSYQRPCLFVKPDPDNGKALYAALVKFSAPLAELTPGVKRVKFLQSSTPALTRESSGREEAIHA